jgi:uncharacterized protein (TIGR02147 family)
MNIFLFSDYKKYVFARLDEMPKRGKGQLRRMAQCLRVHSSFMSQVFRGAAQLSVEQAYQLGFEHFGLSEIELQYFVSLVSLARASQPAYRKYLGNLLRDQRDRAIHDTGGSTSRQDEISEKDQLIFFSSWQFSAVYAALGLPERASLDLLSKGVKLSPVEVRKIVDHLIMIGLAVEDGDGGFKYGRRRLHIPASSPLSPRHHINWRIKAIEHASLNSRGESFQFTFPMAIGSKDFDKFKMAVSELIGNLEQTLEATQADKLVCLNIDLFPI